MYLLWSFVCGVCVLVLQFLNSCHTDRGQEAEPELFFK
jgi:hypothetical protein